MKMSAFIVRSLLCTLIANSGCSKDMSGAPVGKGLADGSVGDTGEKPASSGADGARPELSPESGTRNSAGDAGARTGADGRASDPGDSAGPADTGQSEGPKEASADCPPLAASDNTGASRVVKVDAQNVIGTIRSLQGAHWDPGTMGGALSKHYIDMGVDLIRTHDIGGINGSGAGDVDGPGRGKMFPDMSADSTLEASYNFGPTDSVIKNIRDTGAQVYFRVGRSNLTNAAAPPADFDKYADVVKHIVMHYNQGWAKGQKLGIKWFEIWNEPDFTPFWTGTADQYHELYGKIASAIRAADPDVLIGGPANSSFNDKMGTRAGLLKYIKDNKLPLDFYSFHKYTNKSQDPMDFARMARSFRDELDMFGFTNAKIVNSEWETSLQGDVMLGGEAGHAAFTADALIYMQNGPVDLSTSYMNISATPTKESLAFGALSKLNTTPQRLCAQGGDDFGFAVLAGVSKTDPQLQIVIANYQISSTLMGPIPGGNDETLNVPGLGKLADITYPDRRTFMYPDKEGYALTVTSIPAAWGDVTVAQFRIDAGNNLGMVSSTVSKLADRKNGSLTVSGKWAHAAPGNGDPKGAAQGVDLITVTGTK